MSLVCACVRVTQRNQGLFGTVISAFSRAPGYSRHNSVVAAKLSPSNSVVTPSDPGVPAAAAPAGGGGGRRSPAAAPPLTPSPPSDTAGPAGAGGGGARSPSPRLLSPQLPGSTSFLSVDYAARSPTPPPLAAGLAAAGAGAAASQLSPSNSLLLSSTDNSRRTSRQR